MRISEWKYADFFLLSFSWMALVHFRRRRRKKGEALNPPPTKASCLAGMACQLQFEIFPFFSPHDFLGPIEAQVPIHDTTDDIFAMEGSVK